MSDKQDSLETKLKALQMDHLTGSTAELKERAERATQEAEKPQEDPKKAARRQLRYTFDFDFTGRNGKVWAGRFTSVIPTIRVRQMIGALRAQMAGSIPAAALDDETASLNFVLANLTFMLDDKADGFPAWALDLRALEDPEVLFALWNTEVQPHEATFLGRS